jgi:hypothetical protein
MVAVTLRKGAHVLAKKASNPRRTFLLILISYLTFFFPLVLPILNGHPAAANGIIVLDLKEAATIYSHDLQ